MTLFESPAGLTFKDLIIYPHMQIEEHKFTFIGGKSGCGKSTYLKMLNRTVIPSKGMVYYKGKDIVSLDVLSYRREVMLVPQEVYLPDDTIRNAYRFYYETCGRSVLDDDEILHYLHIACTDFDPDTDCTKLSGGERQRVFLSIYLSCRPKVLLLDEPTAALDPATSKELLQNLKEHCQKHDMSAVCVCHNDALIEAYADAVIRLGGNHE